MLALLALGLISTTSTPGTHTHSPTLSHFLPTSLQHFHSLDSAVLRCEHVVHGRSRTRIRPKFSAVSDIKHGAKLKSPRQEPYTAYHTHILISFAESESSSSDQTSSDKLSALPTQSSPPLGRLRSPSRLVRRSIDMSGSLSSMDSPGSAVQQSLHQPSGYMRASESDGSIDVGTMRGRQSVESDRASLPATLQGIKQGESGLQMKGGDVLSSTFET